MTEDLDARAKELDREYVFHSWPAQAGLDLPVIAGGSGSVVWDHAGNRYLDFASQLVNVNIGHQHPAVVKAIQEQAELLATIGPATANLTRGRGRAAHHLEGAGRASAKVFFTNGGADANENAIRMARLHTGRDTVLSTYRSYHGNTGAAIVATGDWRRMPNQYARGHVHFFGPYLYRSEFWATTPEEESARALHHLERVIQSEGPATDRRDPAGVGTRHRRHPAAAARLPRRRPRAVRPLRHHPHPRRGHGGFGRTGRWFAFEGYDVVPDLITFAKGVNSGYVPVGGVIISDAISATFDDRVFPGGLTYSGHPLAAASIIASIDAMESEGIVENARRIGAEAIGPGLEELAERHPLIGEVRGEGVFWALELVSDRDTREPVGADVIGRLKKELSSRGLLPFTADNRIHVVPPCVVTDEEVSEALAIYDEALTSVEADTR